MEIDLNCDLGEGCGDDAALMSFITSANISCGFHAGDSETAHAALTLARNQGVATGAHPGFADREHFGRRELDLSPDAVFRLCIHQIGALIALARQVGTPIRYIKPHGGLYNMACRDERFAQPVIAAAEFFELSLMGLPESSLEKGCTDKLPFISEGFADRRYLADGSLVPRSRSDAFVEDVEEAVAQAEWLIRQRGVQSLCVHGDNPRAVDFVRHLREELIRRDFRIRACT